MVISQLFEKYGFGAILLLLLAFATCEDKSYDKQESRALVLKKADRYAPKQPASNLK